MYWYFCSEFYKNFAIQPVLSNYIFFPVKINLTFLVFLNSVKVFRNFNFHHLFWIKLWICLSLSLLMIWRHSRFLRRVPESLMGSSEGGTRKDTLTFWCCQPTSHSQVILPINEGILDTASGFWIYSDSCFICFEMYGFVKFQLKILNIFILLLHSPHL